MKRSILTLVCYLCAAAALAQTPTPEPPAKEPPLPPGIVDPQVHDAIKSFEQFRNLAGTAYRVKVDSQRKKLIAELAVEMDRLKKAGSLDDAVKLRDYIVAQEDLMFEDEPLPVAKPQPDRIRLPRIDFFVFGTSKYFLAPVALPWWKADEAARRVGGHIVRFESKEEYQAIATKFSRPEFYLWVDGRRGSDDVWYDSEDQKTAMPPWYTQNPKGGERRHAVFDTRGAHDVYGDGVMRFVVEIEPEKPQEAASRKPFSR